MILDTNALSAFAKGEHAVVPALQGAKNLFLPAIVLGEYRYGLRASRNRAEREAWLSRLETLSPGLKITTATAEAYADVRHELKLAGTPIPANDAWIAALAREKNLPVLSRDRHFDSVPRLRRVAW